MLPQRAFQVIRQQAARPAALRWRRWMGMRVGGRLDWRLRLRVSSYRLVRRTRERLAHDRRVAIGNDEPAAA